jgi:hypothetical protein
VRFRLRSLFVLIAILALLLTAYRWRPIDGVIDFGNSGHTVWAEGYSDTGFRAVRLGMKRDQVYALIGQPFEHSWIDPRGHTVEQWTAPGDDANTFRRRDVIFSGDTVVEKVSVLDSPY